MPPAASTRIPRRAVLYSAHGERKRKNQKQRRREVTWLTSRLRGTPAAFIGLVDAPDAATAKALAIRQFNIRREDQERLIAVRYQ